MIFDLEFVKSCLGSELSEITDYISTLSKGGIKYADNSLVSGDSYDKTTIKILENFR